MNGATGLQKYMNKYTWLSLSPVLLLFNLLFMFSGLILLVELHCKVNKTKMEFCTVNFF